MYLSGCFSNFNPFEDSFNSPHPLHLSSQYALMMNESTLLYIYHHGLHFLLYCEFSDRENCLMLYNLQIFAPHIESRC